MARAMSTSYAFDSVMARRWRTAPQRRQHWHWSSPGSWFGTQCHWQPCNKHSSFISHLPRSQWTDPLLELTDGTGEGLVWMRPLQHRVKNAGIGN
jgi:hypothetical protein